MLAEVEKGCTFAPAITAKFLRFSGGRREGKEIIFFSEKLARNKKAAYLCAPHERKAIVKAGRPEEKRE